MTNRMPVTRSLYRLINILTIAAALLPFIIFATACGASGRAFGPDLDSDGDIDGTDLNIVCSYDNPATYIPAFSVVFGRADEWHSRKARWIENAFFVINAARYPRVKAISWWHENFDASRLRIDSTMESLAAYRAGASSARLVNRPVFQDNRLMALQNGIYHSAFPDFGGTEDIVSIRRIREFESIAGRKIAWAYFSNNWYQNIEFPADAVATISAAGSVPFIRIMARTNFDEGGPDPIYTMQRIIDGDFDAELEQWAIDASQCGIPLLAEFGTEVNGNWFPWNGQYSGAGIETDYGDPSYPDGPERFRDAYRHIIDICRRYGADNITWFFHVDAYGYPETRWNRIENYYPGDEYIDWLGVSVYGPQENGEEYQDFSEIMDDVYPILERLANKPIAVLEFAITELEEQRSSTVSPAKPNTTP